MDGSIFKILDILDNHQVHYNLERTRSDTIQINAVFVGARVEIEVFEDGHIEMSRFLGNEDVESGSIDMILGLIENLS